MQNRCYGTEGSIDGTIPPTSSWLRVADWLNGVHVLNDGEHTGATPGRALWGPGKVH